MKRLGYTRFVAQGGDWGAIITTSWARRPRRTARHPLQHAGTLPPDVSRAITSNVLGSRRPTAGRLSRRGEPAYDQLSFLFTKGIGYAVEMGTRPQTLYGLADSPVALAAWMLDHDACSYDDITQAFVDGDPVDSLTRDEMLDNITLTWLTNTGSRRPGSTGRTSSGSSTSRASRSRRP